MHGATRTIRLKLLLLPLMMMLLLAQQGAWLHQLSHAAYTARTQVLAQQSSDADSGSPCPTCQAFGQVSFSASPTLPSATFLTPGYLPGDEPRFSIISAAQPVPRSRGPPST